MDWIRRGHYSFWSDWCRHVLDNIVNDMTNPFPYYPDRTWKGSMNYSARVGDPGRFLWTFAWGNPSRLLKKHVHREWHCSWEISDPRNSLGNFTTQVWCMLVMDFTHVTNITPSLSYLHAQGRPLCCFFLLHAIKHCGVFVCFAFFVWLPSLNILRSIDVVPFSIYSLLSSSLLC